MGAYYYKMAAYPYKMSPYYYKMNYDSMFHRGPFHPQQQFLVSREAHLFCRFHSRGSLSSRLYKTSDESEDLSQYYSILKSMAPPHPNKY